MSIGIAFRAFFAALSDRQRSEAIRRALEEEEPQRVPLPPPAGAPGAEKAAEAPRPTVPSAPQRNDALTLLATLQREARLIDLIEEPLDQFTDAQIGAAARPCLKQCRAAIDRMFGVRPLVDVPEGETLTPPGDTSPIRVQWIGDAVAEGATGQEKRSGRVVHPGWRAERCELAQWNGRDDDAMVIAATQLQA